MTRTALLVGIGFAAFHVVGCGFAEVLAPQAPTKEIPKDVELRTTPAEPGFTRVILDANGEKATVTEVVDATSSVATGYANGTSATVHGYSETVKPICIAPCSADLKPGMHVLRFTSQIDDRQSEASIQVGDQGKVVRHAMGRTESFSWGNFGAEMLAMSGAGAAGMGGLLYGRGAASNGDSADDLKSTGGALLAAGLGAMLVGIPLMLLTRPVHQPGATTEMALNK